MALADFEITYVTGAERFTRMCYDKIISADRIATVSATSAQSAAIPANAVVARVRANVALRFCKSSANPTADTTNTMPLAAGETVDVEVMGGNKFAAITA